VRYGSGFNSPLPARAMTCRSTTIGVYSPQDDAIVAKLVIANKAMIINKAEQAGSPVDT
jgi:hypothetical protein